MQCYTFYLRKVALYYKNLWHAHVLGLFFLLGLTKSTKMNFKLVGHLLPTLVFVLQKAKMPCPSIVAIGKGYKWRAKRRKTILMQK